MPQFASGEAKTARAPITVQPAGLSCQVELALMSNNSKVATSVVPFTSTGAQQPVSLPITMPDVEGTYPVYLDILAEDLLVGAYKAIEDVVIMPAGPAWATSPVTTAPAYLPTWCGACWMVCSLSVTNQSSSHFPCSVAIYSRYFMSPSYEWTSWREVLPKNLSSYRDAVSDRASALAKYNQLTMLSATLAPGETKVFSGVIRNMISSRRGSPRHWVKFIGPFGEVVAPSYFTMVEY